MHVLVTAGHVDHGKSTLIEKLTGIDPDRLAEEKRRGMTIELGFAWLTLPSGREVGIVDVPGHERFVPTMLAGAGSADRALLVVAANEGWSRQTEEHAAILSLLGVRDVVVALTKSDLCSPAQIEAVRAGVIARLARVVAHAQPRVVAVSAHSGAGLDELRAALDDLVATGEPATGRARLFVDRVFSAKGAGTVVTGTLTGAPLRTGDEVEISPRGVTARLRGIQSHKLARDVAEPIARVALNLAGVDRDDVARGDAIVKPGEWNATTTLDVELHTLNAPLASRGAYKLYLGSAEVDARIRVEGDFARVHLRAPVVAAPFDRFVLRDDSRATTVAGGRVLDAHPRKRFDAGRLAARAVATLDELPGLVVQERAAEVGHRLVATLERFHAREPMQPGMPVAEARRAAGIEEQQLFDDVVAAIAGVETTDTHVKLTSHDPSIDAGMLAKLLDDMAASPAPGLAELEDRYGAAFVKALLRNGTLVKLEANLVMTAAQIAEARAVVERTIRTDGPRTASQLKDALKTTRKYAIPLLEHFDAAGVTRRTGDTRDLRTQ